MSEAANPALSRKRLYVTLILVFVAGVVCGCLLAVFGVRYLFFHFRPSPKEMVADIAGNIIRDFNLPQSARPEIEEEIHSLMSSIRETLDKTRDHADAMIAERAERFVRFIPDEAGVARWRKENMKYFRRPPPFLAPFPPPPPPPGGAGAKTE